MHKTGLNMLVAAALLFSTAGCETKKDAGNDRSTPSATETSENIEIDTPVEGTLLGPSDTLQTTR